MPWRRTRRRIKGEEREVLVRRYNGREKIRMVNPRRGKKPQLSRYKITNNEQEKWFHPKDNLSGWKKNQTDTIRMKHIQAEINERSRERKISQREAKLSVARSLQALANVTQDRETKYKAQRDARILYGQLKN